MNMIRNWLKLETLDGKKITNFVVAINYLGEFDGSNTVLGTNYLHDIMTNECFDRLVEAGYLELYDKGWYKFNKFVR